MTHSYSDAIRHHFRSAVCQHLRCVTDEAIVETTLIRGGSYCGRKFSLLGFQLIWFVDEQQIKLYGHSGELISSSTVATFCGIHQDQHTIRRAA